MLHQQHTQTPMSGLSAKRTSAQTAANIGRPITSTALSPPPGLQRIVLSVRLSKKALGENRQVSVIKYYFESVLLKT
jgi:hypothetical protein